MLFSIRLNTFSNGSFMMTHKALGNQKISSIAMNSWMSLKTIKNRIKKEVDVTKTVSKNRRNPKKVNWMKTTMWKVSFQLAHLCYLIWWFVFSKKISYLTLVLFTGLTDNNSKELSAVSNSKKLGNSAGASSSKRPNWSKPQKRKKNDQNLLKFSVKDISFGESSSDSNYHNNTLGFYYFSAHT